MTCLSCLEYHARRGSPASKTVSARREKGRGSLLDFHLLGDPPFQDQEPAQLASQRRGEV